jgi:hypothetical protein
MALGTRFSGMAGATGEPGEPSGSAILNAVVRRYVVGRMLTILTVKNAVERFEDELSNVLFFAGSRTRDVESLNQGILQEA